MDFQRGFRLARALQGKRYILCLDEIEKMKSDSFSADVRDELRGLADGASAPLTLVVTSSLPLAELFPDIKGAASPLYNIFYPITVPPLSREEARNFIATHLQSAEMHFSEDEIDNILEQSQCNPRRLQESAAELFRKHSSQILE
jgi:type II secretory pathway predicted ATPase ExeA